jgi:hypothetical protein
LSALCAGQLYSPEAYFFSASGTNFCYTSSNYQNYLEGESKAMGQNLYNCSPASHEYTTIKLIS